MKSTKLQLIEEEEESLWNKKGELNIIKNKPLNISSTPFNRSWLIVVEIIK